MADQSRSGTRKRTHSLKGQMMDEDNANKSKETDKRGAKRPKVSRKIVFSDDEKQVNLNSNATQLRNNKPVTKNAKVNM